MGVHKKPAFLAALVIIIVVSLVVAAFIALPKFLAKPQYKILYASGVFYYNQNEFHIDAGKLLKKDTPLSSRSPQSASKLYIHDISSNKSFQISLEEAQRLSIDTSSKSPDGYEITPGFKLNFANLSQVEPDYSSLHAKNSLVSKKLNLNQSTEGTYNDKAFILGWVK